MSPTRFILAVIGVIAAVSSVHEVKGQTLNFSVSGSFANPVREGSNSLLITDNNLVDGYANGSDLKDAPSSLATSGPAGASFFQWGRASTGAEYPHASALWFTPLKITNVTPEKDFEIGYLYYRNGTIQSSTGASAVNINLTFTFQGGTTLNTGFTSNLINTPNTGTAEQNADIVSLSNPYAATSYKDASGNTYYLELSFKVDQDTLNNSLSNTTEFRAYEGAVARAEMIGRFTTTPTNHTVPEPSALLIGLVGCLPFIHRRKR